MRSMLVICLPVIELCFGLVGKMPERVPLTTCLGIESYLPKILVSHIIICSVTYYVVIDNSWGLIDYLLLKINTAKECRLDRI